MIPLAVVNQGAVATEITISGEFVNLDLYSHFEMVMRRNPRPNEKVIFTTTADTKITSLDVDRAALNIHQWPDNSNDILLINKGLITGKGGNGGTGAAFYRRDGTTNRSLIPHNATTGKIAAVKGSDGGPAISNKSAVNLNVINSGKIYGGGGGGGGSGAWAVGFAINANRSRDVQWLSFAPNGDKMAPNMTGSGAGGGGAPFGEAATTTLSLDWFSEKYPEFRDTVTLAKRKVISLQEQYYQIRETFSLMPNGKIRFDIAAPQNFSFADLNNRQYDGFSDFVNGVYDKLRISRNRYMVLHLDLDNETRAKYRPYMPEYSTVYDSKYLNGNYAFYKSTQTRNYSGSGDSNRAGAALVAQRVQKNATATTGGVGGAQSEGAMLDGTQIYSSGFVGWLTNPSTGKIRLKADSVDAVRGGAGGNLGEDGESGILTRVYYRGGNSYRYFNLPYDGTRMETLPPSAGGRAGYVKTGKVTIANESGGIAKGR